MSFHRFRATFEIILAESNNTSTKEPDPMPDDLAQDLIKEIQKTSPKKGGQTYRVERVGKKS